MHNASEKSGCNLSQLKKYLVLWSGLEYLILKRQLIAIANQYQHTQKHYPDGKKCDYPLFVSGEKPSLAISH